MADEVVKFDGNAVLCRRDGEAQSWIRVGQLCSHANLWHLRTDGVKWLSATELYAIAEKVEEMDRVERALAEGRLASCEEDLDAAENVGR